MTFYIIASHLTYWNHDLDPTILERSQNQSPRPFFVTLLANTIYFFYII